MLEVRPATQADLPAIRDIYNLAGVPTTATWDLEPVDLANRETWFERLTAAGCPVFVLTDDGVALGYAAYAPFRPHGGYRHTVEHSIYVMPGRQSLGGGTMLMEHLIRYATEHDVHVMVGGLDAGNEGSRRFHRKFGFREVGVLPEVGRKFDRWLDLLFVTKVLRNGTAVTSGQEG